MKIILSFVAGAALIFIALVLFSCNRKLHTERTETHQVDDSAHTIDSLSRIIKTWANAYEDLLKTTNSTGVVFESVPCDSAKIGGAGLPHILIKADGTKEFSGPIKSYKDDATKYQRTIFSMQGTIDSLLQITKKDIAHHEASAVVVVRNIKSTFIPFWVWIIIAGLAVVAIWRRA